MANEVQAACDNLHAFFNAYTEAALWSSTDDDGDFLDANYDINDITAETLDRMLRDCAAFLLRADHLIRSTEDHFGYNPYSYAGHDFWLTRGGHGAGFWDGDWPEELGDELTKIAKEFGQFDLLVGDDGKIHGFPL